MSREHEPSAPGAGTTPGGYEPPAIEEREHVDLPLVGVISGPSAAFHSDDAVERADAGVGYEPPAIEERECIDLPLVAVTGSPPVCAAFRS